MRKTQLLTFRNILVFIMLSLLLTGCNGTSEQGLKVVDSLDLQIVEIIKTKYVILFPDQLSSLDVNVIDSEGNSYVSLAVEHENMFILHQLVNEYSDIAVLDINGSALLEKAIEESYLGISNIIISYLKEKKLPYESVIYANLYRSIDKRNDSLTKYLTDIIINLDTEPVIDPEVFLLACRKGHVESMEYLLTIGYDVNLVDENGRNGLIYAMDYQRNTEFMEYLIENGIEVDHVSNDGKTPLLLASKRPLTFFYIQLLVDNGADVNYVDPKGKTALDYAREIDGNEYSVSILEEHGALSGEEVRGQS